MVQNEESEALLSDRHGGLNNSELPKALNGVIFGILTLSSSRLGRRLQVMLQPLEGEALSLHGGQMQVWAGLGMKT